MRRAGTLIAVSRYAANAFRTPGSVKSISVLYNPLDLERFDATRWSKQKARRELGLPADRPVVGIIAQITPWKSHDTLIEAFADVVKRVPQARLAIVGDAKFVGKDVRFNNLAFKERLHDLVRERELEEVVSFWGERSDIPAVAAAMDAVAVPSWEEPLGRAALEAMAMCTPVLVTSVGGAAEVVRDGVDGRVLPPREPAIWADAIVELLEDPELRRRMGLNGQRRVREFERHAYVDRLRAVYSATLGTRGDFHVVFVDHTATIGGAQRSLLGLLADLPSSVACTVACPEGDLAEAVRRSGVRVVTIHAAEVGSRFDARHTLPVLLSLLRGALRMRRITRERPVIVHANTARAGLLSALFKRSDAPVIVHLRDVVGKSIASRLARAVLARRADAVIANSHHTLQTFRAPPGQASRVVHNGVDASTFSPSSVSRSAARDMLALDDEIPVLAVVAQITPWKRQDFAIRVLDRVRRNHPDAQLLLAGSPKFVKATTSFDNRAYNADLHRLCVDLGLADHVRFLGELDDVRPVYAAADMVLLPSRAEPFGRALIESMAMRTPVIASRGGGPAEIVEHGVSGWLLPLDDLEEWSDAVTQMLDDPGLRDRMGKAGRARVCDAFTAEIHAAGVLDAYRSFFAYESAAGAAEARVLVA